MSIIEKLNEIANHDWRVSHLAHTSDTAKEAAYIIERLVGLVEVLDAALVDLLEQVESLEDYTLTRDVETYKAQACWDDVIRQATAALKAIEFDRLAGR